MARPRTVSFEDFASPDRLAADIANKYTHWRNQRSEWLEMTKEARDYVFATDTRSTSSGGLGWKNSTHLPKLCQIRDNLHANYMATAFPNDKAITFEADDRESNGADQRRSIEAYMSNKMRLGGFREEMEKCLLDYIDYGNCFAMGEFINQTDPRRFTKRFVGPQGRRISPLDIVFDPTAVDFLKTPKIIRELTTLGDIQVIIEDFPEDGYLQEVFDLSISLRQRYQHVGGAGLDVKKNDAYRVDGFGSFKTYFDSDYVELLHFYGDIWCNESMMLKRNQHIVVVDRAYIIHQSEHPNWKGRAPIHHAGWRVRPENLYAMGPLDNLIGLQYRLDHLENAKADALDMILHPVFKIRGYVEDFEYGPNERIYVGEEGDVDFMNPDASVLQMNTEIGQYMQLMEEMAGAPRQAMGFRTPGEKTKFEVQVLENGANRVFINKISHWESQFLEPLLNDMLEIARRNFIGVEEIATQDSDFNFVEFLKITPEQLMASGNLRAVGARRFAHKANILQNLVQYSNTPLGQDQGIRRNFSGFAMAKMVESLLEVEDYKIVERDVQILEDAETQRLMGEAQQQVLEEAALDPAQGLGLEGPPPEDEQQNQ